MSTSYRSISMALARNLVLYCSPAQISHQINIKRNLSRRYLDPEMPILREFLSIRGQSAISIDVGANLGLYSQLFSSFGGSVVAFEPQYSLYRYLLRVLPESVSVHNKVLSSQSGHTTLRIPHLGRILGKIGRLDALATMHDANDLDVKGIKGAHQEEVEVVTLDEFVSSFSRVDILKIDVEGHEFDVLLGGLDLISRFKPLIFMEIAEKNGSDSRKICDLMKSLNYSLYQYSQDKGDLVETDLSFNRQTPEGLKNFNFLGFANGSPLLNDFRDSLKKIRGRD